MSKSAVHWQCLDCGTDLLQAGADYFMLRHRLWRQIVPRLERHRMLCRRCVAHRLGRPLVDEDFLSKDCLHTETADPEDGPMELDDYGILDSLRVTQLTAVDAFLCAQARARAQTIGVLVHRALEDPSPDIPWVTDRFYGERIGYLIELGELIVVDDHEDFWKIRVRARGSEIAS